MSSRTRQARLLFQRIPPQYLLGTTLENLTSRCEAYLSAVDIWANKGNAKAVQQAGTGLVALCAWKAAKALAEDAQVEPFQNASGISRQQFTASEKDLTPAFQSVSLSRPSTSLPSTPQRNAMYRNFIPSSSSSSSASISSSAKSTAELTPEAKFQRAKDVISGAAFASTSSKSSPLFNRVAAVSDFNSHNGTPQTPTSRRLSDRSSIKETHIFDPSDLDTTPTKKSVVFDTSTLAHSGGQSKKRSQEVIEQVDLVPRKALLASKRRRHKILIGYPAGEPLRKGRFEVMGEWDDSHCKERVKKYMEALQRCQDSSGWQADEVMGEIQLTELN